MGRRGWLAGMLAMTVPGLGGQQPPPQNSAPAGQLTPGVQPGVSGQIIARRVIIAGSGGELFVYDSTPPAAGNLILSISGVVGGGTDPFGNHYVFGLGVYDNVGGYFSQYGAGFATFGTGSLSAGWTANTSIQNDSSGNLYLDADGDIYANGVLIS